MHDTIIVPLDGSEHAEFALPIAIDETQRNCASLLLLHVVPRPEASTQRVSHGGPSVRPPQWSGHELDEAVRLGHRYLERVKQRCRLSPETMVTVVVGEPVKRILAEAERRPRSLIVLTTGDACGNACPPLSEVARRVLVAGSVPVLGVRHRPPVSGDPIGPNGDIPAEQRSGLPDLQTDHTTALDSCRQ